MNQKDHLLPSTQGRPLGSLAEAGGIPCYRTGNRIRHNGVAPAAGTWRPCTPGGWVPRAWRRAVSLAPRADQYDGLPHHGIFFRDITKIRCSAVIQCCPTHPAHARYMQKAAENRERIAREGMPLKPYGRVVEWRPAA